MMEGTVQILSHELTREDIDLLHAIEKKTEYTSCLLQKVHQHYSDFQIAWVRDEDEVAGFALFHIVKGSFLAYHDDYRFIENNIDHDQRYLYIPYFEIVIGSQSKGFGQCLVNWFKETYASEEILVYSTRESCDFWTSQSFTELDDDYWLHFKGQVDMSVA